MSLRAYVEIARVDHWFKNLLMLPGTGLAALLAGVPLLSVWPELLLGIASACLVASANYALNEWLDAEFDRFHPVKRNRPSVVGALSAQGVYLEYGFLLVSGLGLAACISLPFLGTAAIFAAMGIAFSLKVANINMLTFYFTLFITPLFLFSDIFFPIAERLSGVWVGVAEILPLLHPVRLIRAAFLGKMHLGLLWDVAYIAVLSGVLLQVAARVTRRRLSS